MIQAPQNYGMQQPAVQQPARKPSFAPSYNAVQINLDTPTLNAPPAMPYYPPVNMEPYKPQAPVAPQQETTTPAPTAPAQGPQQPAQVPPPVLNDQTAPAQGPQQPAQVEVKPADNKGPEALADEAFKGLSSPDYDVQALAMEDIAKKGLNNQAEALSTMSPLEKNAFSQGLFTQIKQNNGVNQNMAASALDYRSSLADALRPNNFNRLEHGLGQNATQFNRLSEIGNAAESRLNLPQNQRLWGQGDVQASPETSSFGQTLGQIKDKLQGNMLKNSTQNLLNPNFVGTQNNMLLGVYPNVGGVIPSQLYFENN